MGGSTRRHICALLLVIFSFAVFPPTSLSQHTLTSRQSLAVSGNETLVSSNDVFKLGFFSPDDSAGRWYLGIWYKNISVRTYVWVANRDAPVVNSSAILKIQDGKIAILDGDESATVIWSSNQTRKGRDPVAELRDNGNFVLRDADGDASGEYLWQSFDYPTDTLLPDMKLGWDRETGLNRYISSWRTTTDPSIGDISFKMDLRGFPEFFLRNKETETYRSGPWNGVRFSGVPEMQPLKYITFDFTTNPDEITYSFHIKSQGIYSRLSVTPDGSLRRFTWIPDKEEWAPFWYAPKDQCDDYRACGPYGLCDTNKAPVCNCIRGFEPKNPQAWNLRDGSGGCVRKTRLECQTDKFLHLRNVKLPETTTAFVDRRMGLKDCEALCRSNCSCTAYANVDIRGGGTGCVVWADELVDIRVYAMGGQDLYVRLAAADVGDDSGRHALIIGVSVGGGSLLLLLLALCAWKRRKALNKMSKSRSDQRGHSSERSRDFLMNEVVISSKREYSGERPDDDVELPLFDFDTIAVATKNFSDQSKLGQGGFGSVYKGRLLDGQEIAVKRLSKTSVQGVDEFKNELRVIAKLQHRNLVRLLGCCVEMDEKILVYEYMENKSLDANLFNKSRSFLLNWERRFKIICGIARGLLYLHQDSRLRIIHRDLKASNILLDREMNPKISDFGMARIFGGDQTEASTRKVVGTYGYMSPEYAMDGLFSVKSDAFSFGVLVLEIISGKRNRGFYNTDNELNLLGYAWRLWKEGKGLEIVDPAVGESYPPSEVLRCIQVGLLCVQERAEDRPTMGSVVLMLSSDAATMPQPKTPGYCVGRSPLDTDSSSSRQPDDTYTINQVTVTVIDPR